MRIGELARRTGVSVRSIRHYDVNGLLEADRSENGYREFDESAVGRVRRIKRLIGDGLTVEEVLPMAECLASSISEEQFCTHLLELYEEKLRALDSEIAALQRKRAHLAGRVAQMRAAGVADAVGAQESHDGSYLPSSDQLPMHARDALRE
jgi:DNA-binding transcriptional MerR regulator